MANREGMDLAADAAGRIRWAAVDRAAVDSIVDKYAVGPIELLANMPTATEQIMESLRQRLLRLFNHDEKCAQPGVACVEISSIREQTLNLAAAVSKAEQQLIEQGVTCPHTAAMAAEHRRH